MSDAVENKTSQFEIVIKQVLMHNFRNKRKFYFCYLLTKLRTLGDKSRNILATKTALNFSGPYSTVPITARVLTERYNKNLN